MNSSNADVREYRSGKAQPLRAAKQRFANSEKASSRDSGNESATCLVSSFLHLLQGDAQAAKKQLAAARRAAERSQNAELLYLCMVSEVCLAAQQADADAIRSCLARAADLAPVRAADDSLPLPHILARQFVAPLLALTVQTVSADGEHVGMPAVRIVVVGRFGISVGDRILDLTTIRQKKPLELLKAIIALGGREVPAVRLHEMLWPDADGDAAHRCFTIALHRLRRMVGVNFITYHSGRLSLDPRRCQVDAWNVERQLCALEAMLSNSAVTEISVGISQLLALYRRPFLEGEEAHWVLSVRERLREKCLRILAQSAGALHRAGRHAEAMHCCQKGIEIDPLAEELYRLLMRSQCEQGQPAAAIAAYCLCQTRLQRELDVVPSAATRAIYQQALDMNVVARTP